MKKLYLVTGATGHLGTCLTEELLRRGEYVRVLVRPGRNSLAPPGVQAVEGDVAREDTLSPFFDRTGFDCVTLLHCAAMITIASKEDRRVWDVNVNGTENVMRLARRARVERGVYVSPVHAIPERPLGETIREVSAFSPPLGPRTICSLQGRGCPSRPGPRPGGAKREHRPPLRHHRSWRPQPAQPYGPYNPGHGQRADTRQHGGRL